MNQDLHIKLVSFVVGLGCTVLLSACGSSDEIDRTVAVDFGKSTIASCLKAGHASFARSADELGFLFDAEADEEVSKHGLAYDKAAKIVVNVWSKVTFEDQPSEWIMWIGQPFEERRSPNEIVEAHPPNSYVAYTIKPSASQRRKIESCITF